MGKCVSKDQHLQIREIDERSYVAISDEFHYYRYQDEVRFVTAFALLKTRRVSWRWRWMNEGFVLIDCKDGNENVFARISRAFGIAQSLNFLLSLLPNSEAEECMRKLPESTLEHFHIFLLILEKMKNSASHFPFSRSTVDIKNVQNLISDCKFGVKVSRDSN